MSELFGSALVSDWFLLFILFGIFIALTRWVTKKRAFAGYALGWMIGLLFIVIFGSLAGEAELGSGGDPQLNLLQVFLALMMGVFVGGGSVILPTLAPDTKLRVELRATFTTSISVSLLFLMLIASTEIRRMIGILSLTAGIIILSLYVFGRYRENRLENAGKPNVPAQEPPPDEEIAEQVRTAPVEPERAPRFQTPDAITQRHTRRSVPPPGSTPPDSPTRRSR